MRLGSLLVTSLIQASGKQQTFLKSRTDQPVGASVLLRGESPTTATHLLSLVALVYTGSRPGYLTQLHLSAVGLSFSVSRRVKLFCKGTSGYREDTASPQPSWQAMSNLHSPLLWSPCSLEAAYRGVQGSAVTAAPPTHRHTPLMWAAGPWQVAVLPSGFVGSGNTDVGHSPLPFCGIHPPGADHLGESDAPPWVPVDPVKPQQISCLKDNLAWL